MNLTRSIIVYDKISTLFAAHVVRLAFFDFLSKLKTCHKLLHSTACIVCSRLETSLNESPVQSLKQINKADDE